MKGLGFDYRRPTFDSRRCPACDQIMGRRHECLEIGRGTHALKDQCLHGHPLSGPNLRIIATTGKRVCRECERVRKQQYRARKGTAA